jgi:hypothetical protein
MHDINWPGLIADLRNGRCALVLGHYLLAEDNVPLYTRTCQQLASQHASLIHAYYPEEHFFLFKKEKNRHTIARQIATAFQSYTPDAELYRMLAEIKVPLFISVSPDDYLDQILGENATSACFNHADEEKKDHPATPDKPLVYHIFGSVGKTDSLVLSHDDLYDYFQSMIGKKGLPAAISTFFNGRSGGEVIFVGFNFRRWYVQLLLRLFNLSSKESRLNRTAYQRHKDPADEKFAQQHFDVTFVHTEIKEFVAQLHAECAQAGLLRSLTDSRQQAETLLAEQRQQRVEELKQQLTTAYQLRLEWEKKEMLTDNPAERLLCQTELASLNDKINQLTAELKNLAL